MGAREKLLGDESEAENSSPVEQSLGPRGPGVGQAGEELGPTMICTLPGVLRSLSYSSQQPYEVTLESQLADKETKAQRSEVICP